MHPTQSGYLSGYSGFDRIDSKCRVIGKGDARLVRWASACDLQGIDSFFIEPVAWLADDLGQPASSPERAACIREAFQEALAEQLGTIRPIANAPGPRTAVVRAAVTGIQEAKPLVNLAILVFSGPLFNGGAVVEVEIIGFFHRHRHAERSVGRAASILADDLRAGEPESCSPTSAANW